MNKDKEIWLTEDEREYLHKIINIGVHPSKEIIRARVLLLLDRTEKYDCEYERKGSCAIFMFTEPLRGWREAHALPRRTAVDWANQVKWLVDEVYSDAEKIILVMDSPMVRIRTRLFCFAALICCVILAPNTTVCVVRLPCI